MWISGNEFEAKHIGPKHRFLWEVACRLARKWKMTPETWRLFEGVLSGSPCWSPQPCGCGQWEFQDPKLEVLYHIFGHILWGYNAIELV